jgi:hypothetical protein
MVMTGVSRFIFYFLKDKSKTYEATRLSHVSFFTCGASQLAFSCLVSKSIPSQNHILQNAILLLFFFFLALSLLVFLAGHGLLGGVEATDCGTCPPSVAPCLSGVATTASGSATRRRSGVASYAAPSSFGSATCRRSGVTSYAAP